MSPKYDDEFLKSIREASFDEKVAVLLRDMTPNLLYGHCEAK